MSATTPPVENHVSKCGITASTAILAADALAEIVKQLQAEEAGLPANANFTGLPSSEAILFALGQMAIDKERLEANLRAAESRIDETIRKLDSTEIDAMMDALTNVGNRRAFALDLLRWDGVAPAALALIDIDDFKKLNDEHGRVVGDEVLRNVAELLKKQYGGLASVSRYAGGVFAVVLKDCTIDQTNKLLETTRKMIANREITHGKKKLRATCSIGTTRLTLGEPNDEWLQRVDDALYMSKFSGKNCGHCVDCHEIGKREKPTRLNHDAKPDSLTKIY